MNVAEKFVRYALTIGALELVPEGRKLKSGRVSPYFFNSGLFCTGVTLSKLGEAYSSTGKIILRANANVIFGSAYKGIPIATAVAITMWKKYLVNIDVAFNRKEAKDHGEGGTIVGHSVANKKVCIVDDVMTTGISSGEAADIILANNGIPTSCIIAFDRQELGTDGNLSSVQEFERNYKIPVFSVATLADLITVLEKNVQANSTIPNSKEALKKILHYRDAYGIK